MLMILYDFGFLSGYVLVLALAGLLVLNTICRDVSDRTDVVLRTDLPNTIMT